MNHLFGFLQIVIESLPVSSSGHLALLGLGAPVAVERFLHGPTVLILLVYFYKELWALACNYKATWRQLLCWGILIVFANSFTVLVYALLEKFEIGVPLWVGFAITSFALLSLRWVPAQKNNQNFSLFIIGVIGIVQGCARLGGVSRLGVTYAAAVWLGFTPKKAFRISCALQVPLFAAGFLEGAWGLFKAGHLGYFFSATVLVAGLVAMAVAYCALAWVERLMVNKKLWYLGVYMTIPTLLVLFADIFLVGM